MTRQKLRKLLLFISPLLFPLAFLHLSPVLPIEAGLLDGIINGGLFVFAVMFAGSIFFGRAFCACVCPGGGLQEYAFTVSDKRPKQGWKSYIKYWIWVAWILAVIFCFIRKGQVAGINLFWGDSWAGIARILPGAPPVMNIVFHLALFYTVVATIFLCALFGGKRAFCHYFCWMVPFMALGIKPSNILRLPGLHIAKSQ